MIAVSTLQDVLSSGEERDESSWQKDDGDESV